MTTGSEAFDRLVNLIVYLESVSSLGLSKPKSKSDRDRPAKLADELRTGPLAKQKLNACCSKRELLCKNGATEVPPFYSSDVEALLRENLVLEQGRAELLSNWELGHTQEMTEIDQGNDSPERDADGANPPPREQGAVAEAATTPEVPLADRIAHVVFGSTVADEILQLEKARAGLADQVAQRTEQVASSIDEFQSELNAFCDTFGRKFDTYARSAEFARSLNARLRTLGFRLFDPIANLPGTLQVAPTRKQPPGGKFYIQHTKKGAATRTTSEEIPDMILSPL